MEKEAVFNLIKDVLRGDRRIVFAYVYGSFINELSFNDIDIGIYVKDSKMNPFLISSDIKTKLSILSKKKGMNFTADQFDVKILNEAPFTFLKRIFTEGNLLIDNDPDFRTDRVEQVSLKYRECAGLLAEASLG